MKKIFFKNDAEFNKYIEKADDLGHRKTFHKKNEIIKIFNVRGLISSGFFNTYASRIIKNSLKLKKYDITYESHIVELAKLRDESSKKGAWSAAINAEVARGKAAGLYIEQKIIRTGKLDDLSEEELDKRIAETLDQYSPILNAIDVTEFKEEIKSNQEKIRLDPKQRNNKSTELIDYSLSSSSSDSHSSSSSSKESSSDSSEE